jgi:hypothetical protein
MSLTKIVTPIMDSRAIDVSMFDQPEIYFDKIEDEKPAPVPPACFLGAWYRKVYSSMDKWLGFEGVVTLGEFIPDESRFNLDGNGRYMDNPSVYIGGKSKRESDAGLGLNLTYLSNDTSQDLVISSPKMAYRPFWRYIYNEASDIDFNVRRREVNSWNVSNPRNLGYYYFPGDVLRMKIYSPIDNYLQLRIEVIEPTSIPKYVELRKKYRLKDNRPLDFYSPIFDSEGHGYENAEFKRVNSIDQYGNEGYNAKNTNAMVTTSIWHESFLYRKIDGVIRKVPMSTERQSSMICPNQEAISVENINGQLGSESITIHPGKCGK